MENGQRDSRWPLPLSSTAATDIATTPVTDASVTEVGGVTSRALPIAFPALFPAACGGAFVSSILRSSSWLSRNAAGRAAPQNEQTPLRLVRMFRWQAGHFMVGASLAVMV